MLVWFAFLALALALNDEAIVLFTDDRSMKFYVSSFDGIEHRNVRTDYTATDFDIRRSTVAIASRNPSFLHIHTFDSKLLLHPKARISLSNLLPFGIALHPNASFLVVVGSSKTTAEGRIEFYAHKMIKDVHSWILNGDIHGISDAPIRSVKFSATGIYFAALSSNGSVIVWNTNNRQVIRVLGNGDHVAATIAFHPHIDNCIAVSNIDGVVQVFNLENNITQRLTTHFSAITSLTFDESGHYFAVGSREKKVGLWLISDGKEIWVVNCSAAVSALNFHRETILVGVHSAPLLVLNRTDGSIIRELQKSGGRVIGIGVRVIEDLRQDPSTRSPTGGHEELR